jgi:hypothetical protein
MPVAICKIEEQFWFTILHVIKLLKVLGQEHWGREGLNFLGSIACRLLHLRPVRRALWSYTCRLPLQRPPSCPQAAAHPCFTASSGNHMPFIDPSSDYPCFF